MEYTIRQLADLSGVSTRTLRWYDKLGLLCPGRQENGYRLYGGPEVDRLQQILFYRALGVELARIKEILDDPAFDVQAALRSHLTALQEEQARIQKLIDTVQETIAAQERKEIMADEKKFAAFKHQIAEVLEREYGVKLREEFGDAAAEELYTLIEGIPLERYQRLLEGENLERVRQQRQVEEELLDKLSNAAAAGADPKGETGREAADLLFRWFSLMGDSFDPARCRELAEFYVQEEELMGDYDERYPGSARFLRDAVLFWMK